MYALEPLDDTAREEHAIVEAALQTYPSTSAPANFRVGVMARLKTLPQESIPGYKFQFPWMELVASFVMLTMLGVAWIVWEILPPVYMARLHLQWIILWQQLGMAGRGDVLAWVIPVGVLAAVMCLGMSASLFVFQRNQG